MLYELNNYPHNAINSFTLKTCLFGTFKLARNAIKSKYTCKGLEIAFERGSYGFNSDCRRNDVVFGVDISSSSHDDNQKIYL